MTEYELILSRYWGYSSFRPLQDKIIESIGNGNDTLGLMPTGGGKSITFQVPAMAKPGLCLVITPLVALMRDQVLNLTSKDIKAASIHGGLTHDQILALLDNCVFGSYKFLYVAPERLSSELLISRLPHLNITLIAVDEAHCISQWGYDFRPSFLKIREIRNHLPDTPILALTATATPLVVEDIQRQLQFKKTNVFRKSFERKNISYLVRHVEDKQVYLLRILQQQQGTAIVYTRSRAKTREISDFLNHNKVSSVFYHAGLSSYLKDEIQAQWMLGEKRVIVATNAFGMGIDKPDVRVVVHIDVPDSIEAYFQEAGRAGRDGERAYAVLLCQKNDSSLLKRRVGDTYPDPKFIRRVYDCLAYFFQIAEGFGFDARFQFELLAFCKAYKLNRNHTHSALKILQLEGYIDYIEESHPTSLIQFAQSRDSLYYNHFETSQLENLVMCILRSYSGVFSQLTAIDEALLAERLGITADEVYNSLVYLGKQGMIQYIPKKGAAIVAYLMDRMDSKYLLFRKQNYTARRDSFENRIHAMVEYINNTTVCRSSYLLAYFGEENDSCCMECDICRSHLPSTQKAVHERLMHLLEQEPRSIHDIELAFPNEEKELRNAIALGVERGEIILRGLLLFKK